MARELVDPRLIATLADSFPSTATIEAMASVQDAMGQPTESWSGGAFLVGSDGSYVVDNAGAFVVGSTETIACCIYGAGGKEVRGKDQTVSTATHKAILADYRDDVTTEHRLVVGSVTYNILAVEQDSQHLATRLLLEVVA